MAHRFAVEWDGDNGVVAGVYVPRRETDSRLAAWSGGSLFPGVYRLARFEVDETGRDYRIDVQSADGRADVAVRARRTDQLTGSLSEDIADVVEFFRAAPSSLSPDESGSCLEGVTLQCDRWAAEPLVIHEMRSAVFDDPAFFPAGDLLARFRPRGARSGLAVRGR